MIKPICVNNFCYEKCGLRLRWCITNGWAYILLGIGTFCKIEWMIAVSTGYLAFLWIPTTPEKIITVAISITLLRFIFPHDKRTLAVLKKMLRDAKRSVKKLWKKKNKRKKIKIGVLGGVLGLVLMIFIVVMAIWHNEISTVTTMKLVRDRNDEHLDGAVYTMHVKGDFYLDKFVEQGGVKSDTELINFITDNITKGIIDMNISDPEIGCSSFTATTKDGDKIFGRNYDFAKTNTCIVFTEKNEGRHASISTVDLQFLGIDVDKIHDDLDLLSIGLGIGVIIIGVTLSGGVAIGVGVDNYRRKKALENMMNGYK